MGIRKIKLPKKQIDHAFLAKAIQEIQEIQEKEKARGTKFEYDVAEKQIKIK